MNNKENLDNKLADWRRSLLESEQAFYRHIEKEHGGYPVTNCHTCKGWVGLIRSAEATIQSIEHTIYSFKQSSR